MTTQSSQQASVAAQAQVLGAAPAQVKADWLDAIQLTCKKLDVFTTDDVNRIGLSAGLSNPPEARVIGPLMNIAKGKGWCVPTATFRNSDRTHHHANPKRQWVSTIDPAVVVKDCPSCSGSGVLVERKPGEMAGQGSLL